MTKEQSNVNKVSKPTLLLFGHDIDADEIVEAIKAESSRQLDAHEKGRRIVRLRRQEPQPEE